MKKVQKQNTEDKKKKRKILLACLIPTATVAVASAITLPLVLTKKPQSEEGIKITYKTDPDKGTWATWVDGNPTTIPLGSTSFKVKINVSVIAESAMVRGEQMVGGTVSTTWTPTTMGEQEIEFTITGAITSFELWITGE